MTANTLDARLLSCAGFVRAGAVFADIGTDHGYLPIFLFKSGKISRAVLTDINEGPLSSAKENVLREGLSDKCSFILTDGAAALSGLGITDYAICGMGGELIARIVSSAPHLKKEGTRLILQPMSRPGAVRECLYSLGFDVLDERYSTSGGKYYLTLLAEYTGKVEKKTPLIYELGEEYPHPCDKNEYIEYLSRKKASLERALIGKAQGGGSIEQEAGLIALINERLSKL